MRKLFYLIFILMLFILNSSAQTPYKYVQLTKEGEKNLKKKEFEKSVLLYREAFKLNSWKAFCNDRYNAACSNAEAGYKDSAFYQLFKIAELCDYIDYDTLSKEIHLISLHNDKRWDEVLAQVKLNIGRDEAKLNKYLFMLLDSVYHSDQESRLNGVAVNNQFGPGSKEAQQTWEVIKQRDAINIVIVSDIIDKYGWLGKNIVGENGNSTLSLVIQRADIKVQEKYLPVMREAFNQGKVNPYDMAILEDIIALKRQKKQIYGSRLKVVGEKKYYILPIEAPETVDERRLKLGLNTMNEYLKNWGMMWNINNYKKDLLIIEEKHIQY